MFLPETCGKQLRGWALETRSRGFNSSSQPQCLPLWKIMNDTYLVQLFFKAISLSTKVYAFFMLGFFLIPTTLDEDAF